MAMHRDPEENVCHAAHPGPARPSISLIFPAYNPGARLETTWKEVDRFLRETNGNWEILFVCDGCTDGTAQRLQQLTTGHSQVRVVAYTPNRGKGHAVRRGLEAARGDWLVFTDVDLAYGWDDVVRLAETLRGGAEVAIASRTHPDSRVISPPGLLGYLYRRHLQSLAFTLLARWLLPLRQRDTQAGLKGLSARAARLLLPELHCDGFGFDCELLTACAHFGLPVVEVPVCVRYEDTQSTTSLDAMGRMVRELLRIRHSWRRRPVPLSAGTGERRSAAA
jgi:dolichyl-phosphate beta-glucosyltransferase